MKILIIKTVKLRSFIFRNLTGNQVQDLPEGAFESNAWLEYL